MEPPDPPFDPPDHSPFGHPADDENGDELFESERNLERTHDYLDLMQATDVDARGTYDEDNQAVYFTISVDDPPQEFSGFACLVKDAYIDICLIRDYSPDVRLKFRKRADEIMNTIGSFGVSLSFLLDEDTLYLRHRVFTEGLNFDVFRACIWSLLNAQSRVAAIMERER